jgi:predicted RNase H-like HicB family nuclease
MEHRFTAIYEKHGEWWVGYIPEIPGAHTQGATLDEARENLKEAAAMVIEANRELAEKELSGRDAVREEIVVNLP